MADLQNNPKVKRFIESGDEERAARAVSMAYLLLSLGNAYQEEANDLLAKHGLMLHNVKMMANRLMKSFDQYHSVLKTMVPGIDEQKELNEDYQLLQEIAEAFMHQNVDVKRGDYYGATLFLPKKD